MTPPLRSRLSGAVATILIVGALQLTGTTCAAFAEEAELTGEGYPLDSQTRVIKPRGKVRCPKVDLVSYRGDVLRYSGALTVHPAFQARLALFEQVAKEVAIEVYGRAPTKIVHLGSYNCRRIRRYPHLISEHGLGNAIDVAGFDFRAAPKSAKLPDGVPAKLKRSFSVRMEDHWNANDKLGKHHSRFLRLLGERLTDHPEIFRVMLGPAWPGHHNHYHFDCADYRLVSIFDD